MADPTMNGSMRRSRLSRHADNLVAGLALRAGEILGIVRVHVLPGAQRQKGPSHSVGDDRGRVQSGMLFGRLRSAFSGRTPNHTRTNNLALAQLTVSDTFLIINVGA
jgi:hypothetical protein